jgi:hypothetical protein
MINGRDWIALVRMETIAAEEHPENATAESAAIKVRADSNSHGVVGHRGLNYYARNHEASYFRNSRYFHVTKLATNEVIRPVTRRSLSREDNSFIRECYRSVELFSTARE